MENNRSGEAAGSVEDDSGHDPFDSMPELAVRYDGRYYYFNSVAEAIKEKRRTIMLSHQEVENARDWLKACDIFETGYLKVRISSFKVPQITATALDEGWTDQEFRHPLIDSPSLKHIPLLKHFQKCKFKESIKHSKKKQSSVEAIGSSTAFSDKDAIDWLEYTFDPADSTPRKYTIFENPMIASALQLPHFEFADGRHPEDTNIPGVTSPYWYYGYEKSFSSLHKEDWGLTSVNILLAGEPKVWIIASGAVGPLIEAKLAALTNGRTCDQFIREAQLWPTQKALKSLDLDKFCTVVAVNPGEAIFVHGSAYHAVANVGKNIAVSQNICDKRQTISVRYQQCQKGFCNASFPITAVEMGLREPERWDREALKSRNNKKSIPDREVETISEDVLPASRISEIVHTQAIPATEDACNSQTLSSLRQADPLQRLTRSSTRGKPVAQSDVFSASNSPVPNHNTSFTSIDLAQAKCNKCNKVIHKLRSRKTDLSVSSRSDQRRRVEPPPDPELDSQNDGDSNKQGGKYSDEGGEGNPSEEGEHEIGSESDDNSLVMELLLNPEFSDDGASRTSSQNTGEHHHCGSATSHLHGHSDNDDVVCQAGTENTEPYDSNSGVDNQSDDSSCSGEAEHSLPKMNNYQANQKPTELECSFALDDSLPDPENNHTKSAAPLLHINLPTTSVEATRSPKDVGKRKRLKVTEDGSVTADSPRRSAARRKLNPRDGITGNDPMRDQITESDWKSRGKELARSFLQGVVTIKEYREILKIQRELDPGSTLSILYHRPQALTTIQLINTSTSFDTVGKVRPRICEMEMESRHRKASDEMKEKEISRLNCQNYLPNKRFSRISTSFHQAPSGSGNLLTPDSSTSDSPTTTNRSDQRLATSKPKRFEPVKDPWIFLLQKENPNFKPDQAIYRRLDTMRKRGYSWRIMEELTSVPAILMPYGDISGDMAKKWSQFQGGFSAKTNEYQVVKKARKYALDFYKANFAPKGGHRFPSNLTDIICDIDQKIKLDEYEVADLRHSLVEKPHGWVESLFEPILASP